jgi:hypothetical protein
MAETNLIHFGVDPQLASLRGKLLMSFGFQIHSCSSLSEIEAAMRRRKMQGCIVCQTVPEKLVESAEAMLRAYRIPLLVLSNNGKSMAESSSVHYSSSSAREFLPKLQAMMPKH